MTNSPIFLCGFMGCGKTTVGKKLSTLIDFEFIDMDTFIEGREGKTIGEIFSEFGESYFRELETKAIEELSKREKIIVATGGGAMLSPKNAEIAKENGTVVYIKVPFEVCYSRIKDCQNRPIVLSSTKEELHALYKKRFPFYLNNSNFFVKGRSNPKNTAEDIIKILEKKN